MLVASTSVVAPTALLPPPALRERRHRGLARRREAVKASVHIHDMPTGTAAAFMIRPTTTPSQSTS